MSESLSNLSGSTELGPESWDWKPGHLGSTPHSFCCPSLLRSCELLTAQISRFRKMVSQVPKKTFLGHNLLEDGGGGEGDHQWIFRKSEEKKEGLVYQNKGGETGVGIDFQKYWHRWIFYNEYSPDGLWSLLKGDLQQRASLMPFPEGTRGQWQKHRRHRASFSASHVTWSPTWHHSQTRHPRNCPTCQTSGLHNYYGHTSH